LNAASEPVVFEKPEHRKTRLRLLELDLKAAELELRSAQEELEDGRQLQRNQAISDQELRVRRRAVDKAMIQVERYRVMLEAEQR
jgi:hypothetical protein